MIKRLTIGQRVSLGFALLVVLASLLGGVAVVRMRTAASGAHFLSDAVAPQSSFASKWVEILADCQLAARTYSLTGESAQLEITRKALSDLETSVKAADALIAAHPELVGLVDASRSVRVLIVEYRSAIEATAVAQDGLAAVRMGLNRAGAIFGEQTERLLAFQSAKLIAEIKEGAAIDAIVERQLKIKYISEITSLGASVRLATFKAQALRDPSLIENAHPAFAKMEELWTALRAITRIKENIDSLNEIHAALESYQAGINNLVTNTAEQARVSALRLDLAERLERLVSGLQERSLTRTLEFSTTSSTALTLSSKVVLVGLIITAISGTLAGIFIVRGLNKTLRQTAGALEDGAAQIAAASEQVAASSQTSAEGASQQAASLEEISSSVEELTSMTKQNAENADSGKRTAELARTAAENGSMQVAEMHQAMTAIQASSEEIAKIVKTIDEIAFQTNLLALNAAVEAARAGEAGAGFAVVADEVRSLAQRSAIASRETASKIEAASVKSRHGLDVSSRVSAGLKEIVGRVRELDVDISNVAKASAEQSLGLQQVNQALSQLDQITQSNAATAEESAGAAEELNAQAGEMRQSANTLGALVGLNRARSVRAKQERTAARKSRSSELDKPAEATSLSA